jgi:hypothetical protein
MGKDGRHYSLITLFYAEKLEKEEHLGENGYESL